MSALLLLLLQQSKCPAWRILVEKYDADNDGDGVLRAGDFFEASIAA